jgi:adenylosuccinate synthase
VTFLFVLQRAGRFYRRLVEVIRGKSMPCVVVVGGFFGDEGKGKIVSYLALKDHPVITARGGVGPNAGHSVRVGDKDYALRMLPCGFVYPESRLLIGPGVLVNPAVLLSEIEVTNSAQRVGVDRNCAIIEQKHIETEKQSAYLTQTIGTTKTGVGVCQAERAYRRATLARDSPQLKNFLTDVPSEIHSALKKGRNVIVEGSQGTYLSLYHGTYPYCTAKDVCASALCSDVGIGPTAVDEVIIVFKVFVTRVGEGPLSGELSQSEIERRRWSEHGTVTGRSRRAAPFDFELAKRAVLLNGATQIALTKFDIVYPECKGGRNPDVLSADANRFIQVIERETGIPVTIISTGPSAEDTIDLRTK